MNSITLMYDSLNRHMLSAYGCEETITPNFQRLAQHTVVFDNFYTGSLPCMPARRDLQTGRCNFLHRSWGPMEPYDKSAFDIMTNEGICTHFVSDHAHYWQEGGLNYHNRFSSYEFIRGQEGDFCIGESLGFSKKLDFTRQDKVNSILRKKEEDYSLVRTFNSGMEFLKHNKDKDNWHLHMEFFDPHEPFHAPERFRKLYGADDEFSWPPYAQIKDNDLLQKYKANYKALLSMCDEYLGRFLDFMDEANLWDNTLLIVNTDHGYMLGEHGFMAKNYMPNYQEIVHTPFFIWDPVSRKMGERSSILASTIDIPATLLDYYNISKPKEMQGMSLLPQLRNNKGENHQGVIFGEFGKHVCVTDGRYVYMRAGRIENMNEYTIMPVHIFTPFTIDELRRTEPMLVNDFSFTDGVPLMKIPASTSLAPNNSCYWYDRHIEQGDLLFDLEMDPEQKNPIQDEEIELKMINLLINEMRKNEAPIEQYERLGLDNFKS